MSLETVSDFRKVTQLYGKSCLSLNSFICSRTLREHAQCASTMLGSRDKGIDQRDTLSS